MDIEALAEKLHKAKTWTEYISLLLASVEELNKYQEERGLKEQNWKIKPEWFAFIQSDKVNLHELYELMRNLHLINLGILCPTAEQISKWLEDGTILY